MNKKLGLMSAAAVAVGMCATSAHADAAGAAMLKISPSARTSALGMTQAVTPDGAEAMGANPANLGLGARRFEVMSTYESLIGGAQYAHVAAAMGAGGALGLEGVGVSVTRLSVGNLTGADAAGNKTGDTFSTSDLVVGLGGSTLVGDHLRLGATVKGLKSTIGSYNSNFALAGDLGATLSFPRITGAVALQNVGQGQKFVGETSPLPTTLRGGVGIPMGTALGVIEIAQELTESKTDVDFGAECWIGPLALRGGYRIQAGNTSNLAGSDQTGAAKYVSGLSGGIGVEVGMVRLDYAVSQSAADYGMTHRVSLLVSWGSADEGDKKVNRPVRAARKDASWYRENYWMW